MRKYVLNIERFYSGATSNALVLNQVDEEVPILLPAVPASHTSTEKLMEWVEKCKRIHPSFVQPDILSRDSLNNKIVDFNIDLQNSFKKRGHLELYMMDNTQLTKPTQDTFSYGKTYLHCIDGKSTVREKDESGNDVDVEVNSSQLNVLFPYRKVSSKSLYSQNLTVQQESSIDEKLEKARGITLQGKVSYEKCLQDVAQIGNNIYVMSPNIDIEPQNAHIHGNGLTIVNSYSSKPYYFPHSMTLFQPSQDQYDGANLAKDGDGVTNFINWYRKHSRKTVVSLNDTYGGNVSILNCMGPGSYGLNLGTYSPTNIILIESGNTGNEINIPLNSDTYRKVRNEEYEEHSYTDKEYVFDNSICDKNGFGQVGLFFNMYDTFITGNDRILKFNIPKDKDFNKLILKFEWEVRKSTGLLGEFEAVVKCNDEEVFYYNPTDIDSDLESGEYSVEIPDTAVSDHDMSLSVMIHYHVDFGKRNTEREYRQMLKQSGVLLKNIRVENGVTQTLNELTFGSYVNEPGITEEEYAKRYNEFWQVSQYKKDLAYQTVVESSLKNLSSAGLKYLNNYSTGDIYGDMFVTKSVLDPRYDMNIGLKDWDETTHDWKIDEDGLTQEQMDELKTHETTQMLKLEGRDYINLGQCSNQLSLFYKPIDIAVGYMREWKDLDGDETPDPDERVYARRVLPQGDSELKYQMVEVVKNINRFESAIKHKSNVFSVVVENSNLAPDNSDQRDEALEEYKQKLRDSVTQFVRNTCDGVVPVHTQLFDVQFT